MAVAVDEDDLFGALAKCGHLGFECGSLVGAYAGIQDVESLCGAIDHDGGNVACLPQNRRVDGLR